MTPPRITATIDVLESLGADKYAYFTQAGEQVAAEQLDEVARDAGAQDVSESGENVITARLDAASRAREGQQLELWFDARKLHVFDPATGENLTLAPSDEPVAT